MYPPYLGWMKRGWGRWRGEREGRRERRKEWEKVRRDEEKTWNRKRVRGLKDEDIKLSFSHIGRPEPSGDLCNLPDTHYSYSSILTVDTREPVARGRYSTWLTQWRPRRRVRKRAKKKCPSSLLRVLELWGRVTSRPRAVSA